MVIQQEHPAQILHKSCIQKDGWNPGILLPKVPPVLDELLSALGPLASVVSTELTRVDAGPSAQGVQKKVIEPRGKRWCNHDVTTKKWWNCQQTWWFSHQKKCFKYQKDDLTNRNHLVLPTTMVSRWFKGVSSEHGRKTPASSALDNSWFDGHIYNWVWCNKHETRGILGHFGYFGGHLWTWWPLVARSWALLRAGYSPWHDMFDDMFHDDCSSLEQWAAPRRAKAVAHLQQQGGKVFHFFLLICIRCRRCSCCCSCGCSCSTYSITSITSIT